MNKGVSLNFRKLNLGTVTLKEKAGRILWVKFHRKIMGEKNFKFPKFYFSYFLLLKIKYSVYLYIWKFGIFSELWKSICPQMPICTSDHWEWWVMPCYSVYGICKTITRFGSINWGLFMGGHLMELLINNQIYSA